MEKNANIIRVLYISYDGALDPLGQSQILPYLRELSGRGVELTLLTFEKRGKLLDRGRLEALKADLDKSGIRWNILCYHKSPTSLATAYDCLAGILLGWILIRKRRIAIVHARSYVPSVMAMILKKISGCKFVFDLRGFWPEERVDGGLWEKGSFLYKWAKFFEKRFIRSCDHMVVLAERAKEIMREHYSSGADKPIEVIPTCADLDRFAYNNGDSRMRDELNLDGRFVFIYSGSVGTWYCLNEMADFFAAARKVIPGAFFLFLTHAKKESVIEFLRGKNIPGGDFRVAGASYVDVPRWLSVADASVSFIRPCYSKQSSCPTKFAESLACGLPVVINSCIGDTDDIVRRENIGVVVEEFSDGGYRKALEELGGLLIKREELRQRCRAAAEKYFSLKDGADKFMRIYEDLRK